MGKYMAKILLLIVEDEMMLAQMYSSKLQKEGFSVDIAHNGREGMSKMQNEHPSLVLMDILMPDTDGLQALRQAKTSASTKDIPVVVLTNMADSNYTKQAMKDGAADYIIKAETTPAQVVDTIRRILKLPGQGESGTA